MDDSKFTIINCPDRGEWLATRRKYIGASDAAAVLGLSPWMTKAQLYDEKCAPASQWKKSEPNADILRGIASESHIRELYKIESGDDVVDGAGMILVSKDYPFMSCTLDGICRSAKTGEDYVLEIKSVRWSGKWSRIDQLPNNYYVQVLHQLVVTGWKKAVLRARMLFLDGGVSERSYIIKAEDNGVAMDNLVRYEEEFWKNNILAGVRPNAVLPSL